MGNKMLIDASQPEETRVVVARGNRIEEFDFESVSRKPLKGNIYLAKVTRVEPSLQAAFVEYGGNRHGFLAFTEIHPDYYQIPIADRIALLKEQEEEDAQEDDDDDGSDHEYASAATPRGEEDHADGDVHGERHDEHHHEIDADENGHQNDLEHQVVDAQALDMHDPVLTEAVIADDTIETSEENEEAPTLLQTAEIISVDEDTEARTVDSVGAEDALEEVPRRARKQQRRRYKIQEVIKRRQILLIQVVKEERGNKGAALTTYLSLAGRYCVLMPNTARGGGISRKITDAGDRRRLKEVAKDIEVPQGMGLIVRTAGAQRTRPEIKRDFDYLMRLWESVRDLTLKSEAPCLVYEEGSLIKRSIRDLYTKDVDEVIVEGEEAYREAKDFMKMLMPSHAKNVKLYRDTRPVFAAYHVETHLDALYSPTVTLPSGGYIVINQTEALVSIDINSGKATREHSIEETASKTNLEACDEIARQLRLRDLAGLIVIDFIDMEEHRNNRAVERRMKDALKNDRARIQVGRISHFGLLEMSRQRLRPGLLEGNYKTCAHCEGRGIVRSVPSCGLGVLRSIEDYLQNKRAENLTVKCARDVAFYLLNEKRDNLILLEHTYGITIFLVPGHDDIRGTQVQIERAGEREHIQRRLPNPNAVKMESALIEDDDTVTEEAEYAEEGEDKSSLEAEEKRQDETGREGGRKRRRRGRRGNRNGDRSPRNGDNLSVENESELVSNEGETNDTADGQQHDANEELSEATVVADENDERTQGRGRGRRGGGRFGRNRSPRDRGPREDSVLVETEVQTEVQTEVPAGEPVDADVGSSDSVTEVQPREKRERGPRGRGRDREGRSERTPRGERPPRNEMVYTAPVVVKIDIPDVIPDPEPRKWQPPAPTVAVTPDKPRKAGWWSKRKDEP